MYVYARAHFSLSFSFNQSILLLYCCDLSFLPFSFSANFTDLLSDVTAVIADDYNIYNRNRMKEIDKLIDGQIDRQIDENEKRDRATNVYGLDWKQN